MATEVKLIATGAVSASDLTLTTASAGTNDTSPATTAFVQQEITGLIDSAPDAMNTLNELAAALGDDANFSTTVTNSIATKLPLAGGTLTGNLTMGGMMLKPSGDGGSIGFNRNPDNGNYVGDSGKRRFQINGPDDTGGDFLQIQSYNSSGTHQGNINIQDGNVGIGITAPTVPLEVAGNIKVNAGNGSGFVLNSSSTTGIFRQNANDLGFTVGGSERMRIGASGNVGLNQAPVANNFTLQVTGRLTDGTDARAAYFKGYGTHTSIGSTGPTVVVQNANNTTNNYAKLSFESASGGETVSINAQNIDHTNHYGDMVFNTRGSGGYSEKMRITSNGNFGIGTTSPNFKLHVSHGDQDGLRFTAPNTGETFIDFGDTDDNDIGRISYDHADNHMALRTNNSERMRINSSGNVGIVGGAQIGAGSGFGPANNAAGHGTIKLYNTATGNMDFNQSYSHARYYFYHGGNEVFRIEDGGHSGVYGYSFHSTTIYGTVGVGALNGSYHHTMRQSGPSTFYWNNRCEASGGFHTYSDERLKENITNISGALDKVALMNGVTFNWIDADNRGSGDTGKQFGVIAQNMLTVDPELPSLNPDPLATQEEIDDDKLDTDYYTMDYSRITPFLIEAVKELKTKLEAAEARIETLEG